MRLINRLIEPAEGRVYLDGGLVSGMPRRRIREVRRKKMGMVFRHFGLKIQGIPAERRRRRGTETLRMAGIEGQGDKQIAELSGACNRSSSTAWLATSGKGTVGRSAAG